MLHYHNRLSHLTVKPYEIAFDIPAVSAAISSCTNKSGYQHQALNIDYERNWWG